MPSALLFFTNSRALGAVRAAAERSGFTVTPCATFSEADAALKAHTYNIAVIETPAPDSDGIRLLKRISDTASATFTAVYLPCRDFDTLLASASFGLCGCITDPEDENACAAIFASAAAKMPPVHTRELSQMLADRDDYVRRYVYTLSAPPASLAKMYTDAVAYVFDTADWADLYFSERELLKKANAIHDADTFSEAVLTFFDDYAALFPRTGDDRLTAVTEYILCNPESDLRLTSIAEKFYMNSTYLSTVFTAQAKMRFVDYIISVKLRRAAFLLKGARLKVTEIAERLGYKDMGYFSKIFKKQYGMTPTEYRTPDNYIYEI